MPLIGTHVSAAGGLFKAVERADALKCESMQLFTSNQLQWKSKELSSEEIKDFKNALEKSKVLKVVSHASYLINLAGTDDLRKKSEDTLVKEIFRCSSLGISDVVLHPGFAREFSSEVAIKRISDSLSKILKITEKTKVSVLLETMSGQGTVIGHDFSQLSYIHNKLNNNPRIGFCVDTCHIFAAGYDIRTIELYNDVTLQLIGQLGLHNIKCWHLNDSLGELGSTKDRHASLGNGRIGIVPFELFMQDERFKFIPAILETPKDNDGDIKNLSILRKLRANKL